MHSPATAFLAAIPLLAGLALLVVAWRRRRQARGALITGGWALIAVSMPVWAIFGGFDRGPAIAVCVLTIAAFAIVMRNGAVSGHGRTQDSDDANPDTRANPERIPWLRRSWIFLLAGPVAFAASAALGLLLFLIGPGSEADRLSLAAYLTPIIWGALATWAVSDPHLIRKSAGVIGSGAASGLAVFLLSSSLGG